MKVAIVKYNAGNIASVQNALTRLGAESVVSDDVEILQQAERVIFPGVGEASTTMQYLREQNLAATIKTLKQPVLGICLGMQLLCDFSEENETKCLGIYPNRVRRFSSGDLKVPHMGWNTISGLKSPLFKNVTENSFVYFVHGYYVEPSNDMIAKCEYGTDFAAAMQRDNFYSVQFHPEKSGDVGAPDPREFFENMIEIIPAIDIIDGKCVRLTHGDFAQKTVYPDDPVETAKRFEAAGIRRLHIVDLDGAKNGEPKNIAVLERIANTVEMTIDFGGGIKTERNIKEVFDAGAEIANLGSIAVKGPEQFFEWLEHYGSESILLGADVRDGKLAINGWQESTEIEILPFLAEYHSRGAEQAFVTDITKDGALAGPARELYREIKRKVPGMRLIASGGVASIEDIEDLEIVGCDGVIVGKAIYEGRIGLDELKRYVS